MKLNKLSLENFKCFEKTEICFSKITLLTGANSSGKSTILHGLLGPLQTDVFPLKLTLNGKYINLGDFTNLSFKHQNQPAKINFEITPDEESSSWKIETEWKIENLKKTAALSELRVTSDYFELKIQHKKKYKINWNYDFSKDPNRSLYDNEFLKRLNEVMREYGPKDDKSVDNLFKEPEPEGQLTIDDVDELTSTSETRLSNYWLHQAINNISRIFEMLDEKSNFISSFRLSPERTYYEKSIADLKVKKDGSNYIDQLVVWENEDQKTFKELIKITRKLGLLNKIKPKRIRGGRFEIAVKVDSKSITATLNDIGFGVSQVLPILVADLQLPQDSMLFVAQPEIHLHPNIQASYADLLIDNVSKTDKSYVLETHSEYIINRIRLAITKKQLSEEDISVYYFRNNGSSSETFKLDFLKNGKIVGAPEDFFTTYMMDVMDIALNATDD